MYKKIISLLLCGLLITAVPQQAQANFLDNKDTVRQVALIAVSLVMATGGTYLISKKSKGFLNKVCSVIGGAIMLGGGIAGVALSNTILENIDYALSQAAKSQSTIKL
jgi:hypothetical protein